jgi:DHA2 family multidrug resistance protein-like MFS transporter
LKHLAQKMDGLPTPRRYLAIVAVSFGTALAVLDGSIVGVALPTLARDLHVSAASAVLIVTMYQLALIMTLLPFSALGVRIGLRRLYQYGQMLFAVATLLCFFAHSLPFLIVVRVLQALGAAAALSVASAMVRTIYPASQLGGGLGINNIVVSISGALAPTLGGLILSFASWRWIFASAFPLAVLSLVLGRRSLPEPVRRDEPYDVLGALLCALTFGLGFAGLESLVHGDSPVISVAVLLAGLGLGAVFVRRELQSAEPILPVDLLARPVLALSVAGALASFIGSSTLMLSLPFRLQQHYGFTPGQVGAVITPLPLAMMVVAPIAGHLSDRVPAGILGGIGTGITALAMLLLALLPEHATLVTVGWRMALAGVGFGLFLAPNARLIVSSTPWHRAASAGGLISTNRLTGQTLGATVAAALLAMNVGSDRTPAFIACALMLVALVCSVARLRADPADAHGP